MFDRHTASIVAALFVSIVAVSDRVTGQDSSSATSAPMPKVRIADDGSRFVLTGSGETFVP